MIKDMLLPNIGEGVDFADVSDVIVKSGDSIAKDDAILVLESEKATMEIPSDFSGIVVEVFISVGDQVKSGQKLISVEVSNAIGDEEPQKDSVPKDEKPSVSASNLNSVDQKVDIKTISQPSSPAPSSIAPFASPGVRRFARELGADLQYVRGSGEKGRILKEDVQNYIKAQLMGQGISRPIAQPVIDFSQWGPVENVSLNKIRRITGERMTTAWQTVPQVTNFDKVDITKIDRLRRAMPKENSYEKIKLTFLPFLIKACTMALKEFPDVNSSLSSSADGLILKKYYHIRIAVDTPEGLMVPVIRDIDKKNVFEISDNLTEVSEKARKKRLMPDDLAGGTFTISSLGGIGGTYFTPIVNPPEVAILGVSRAQYEQVYNGKSFDKKLMLPLTLSYDHRVVDGALAANFMKYLNQLLSDINKLSETNII